VGVIGVFEVCGVFDSVVNVNQAINAASVLVFELQLCVDVGVLCDSGVSTLCVEVRWRVLWRVAEFGLEMIHEGETDVAIRLRIDGGDCQLLNHRRHSTTSYSISFEWGGVSL
jgi:hypothetical protein